MIRTYGSMPTSVPPGFFKAVRFPVLALLDKPTGDHRMLNGEGADTRDLPLSVRGQFRVGEWGHAGADNTGALFEVTIDPDLGVMSGRGFLLDDEFGRRHARAIFTKSMRGNSVDLAEVEARYVEELDGNGDWWIEFTKFKLAATTGVGTPAFAEAYAEIDPLSDEELMASLIGEDPMVELVADFPVLDVTFALDALTAELSPEMLEILASGAPVQSYEDFFRPEGDRPQKIIVTADNKVYGHLAMWDRKHGGFVAPVYPPRPTDSYNAFNTPGVLTERGIVNTGPIFAYGGHRAANGQPDLAPAYGGIENAWADVRIIEGKFGPWISGVVRPGTSEDVVYAARASKISGHWVGGTLKAIVSVNVPGFDVDGCEDEFGLELAAGYAFHTDGDGKVLELVASFAGAPEPTPFFVGAYFDQSQGYWVLPYVTTSSGSLTTMLGQTIKDWMAEKGETIELTENIPEVELASRQALLRLLLEDDN